MTVADDLCNERGYQKCSWRDEAWGTPNETDNDRSSARARYASYGPAKTESLSEQRAGMQYDSSGRNWHNLLLSGTDGP